MSTPSPAALTARVRDRTVEAEGTPGTLGQALQRSAARWPDAEALVNGQRRWTFAQYLGPAGWFRQGWAGIGLIPGTGAELLLRLRSPSALWQLLPGQPKVDAARATTLGLGESCGDDHPDGRSAAVARVHRMASSTRPMLEGYVRLHRSALRAQLEEHFALCLKTQVQLLSDPEFRHRASSAITPASA